MGLETTFGVTVTFIDSTKQHAISKAHSLVDDPTALPLDAMDARGAILREALIPMTNATVSQFSLNITDFHDGTIPPVVGAYPSVEDKAALRWQSADDGSTYKMQIPAPIDSLFLPDGETVDPANALVIALTDSLSGSFCTETGGANFVFLGGKRIRH